LLACLKPASHEEQACQSRCCDIRAVKVAAILAADVVGYSRLMGEDEAGTTQIVRKRRVAATTKAAGPTA
jgi:class 3 adenylate cyclase